VISPKQIFLSFTARERKVFLAAAFFLVISYQTRRGLERVIFYATIILAIVFLGLAVLQLYLG